ncbi:ABC transporter substrate-binding protein [Streptomyces akebiae]|uniref:Iron-siderophore ABC transporter substrate-binding protein n=1 Tax=Streptomyces akebiae TaxID=2865673 RepID=A0ABX8Y3D7_9ACTN|nr:iron-siderophore ABC transporter substrate-binding protein [Streptomyces akebiae]QYX82248.1 iron-siderophore ABC transporter substrate-binding protein [Streptomyces akebiae]
MLKRSPLRGFGRPTAALLTVVLGTGLLAACGDSGTTKADDTVRAGADGAAFPRTLTTVMGDVEIPAQPKKVVVLDTGELDDVTLLGIDPVGAVAPHFKTEGGFPTYLEGDLENTTDVGPLLEPNLEKIASLRPDLILSSKVRHEKVYDKLSAIAPTVFTETTGGVWKENLKVHAEALGLEDEAEAELEKYETRAEALGEEIKKKDGTLPTVSVVRFVAGPTRLYASNSYSGVVLDDVGFRRPKSQISDDPAVTMKDVSPEEIDRADADLIFVTTADTPDKTQQKQVTSNPVWKDLPAVEDGKVFEVPDETWMSGIGVQAAEEMLADIAKATGVELPKQ